MSRKFCVAVILMMVSFGISTAQNTTISCVGNFNLSLNACLVEITPSMIIAGTPNPAITYSVTLKDEHGTPLDDAFVSGEHKDQIITYTLTDVDSGNSCWGTMLVEDKIAPTILGCESGEIEIAPTGCFSYTRLELSMIDLALDNCDPNPELVTLDEFIEQDFCIGDILKRVVRVVKAVDDCGNESSPCQITVPLVRVPFEILDLDVSETGFVPPLDTIIDCAKINPDLFPDNLDFNGNPDPETISGTPVFQVNSETTYSLFPLDEMSHCKLSVVYQDSVLVRDNCFTKIVRHWTVIEGCVDDPQEPLTFVQQITIMDLEAPVMTQVPAKLNFSTNTASQDFCAAITEIPIPELTDNCQDSDDIRLFVTINFQLPQIEYTGQTLEFPDGKSYLEYIATDGCFNGTPPVQGLNETRDTVEVWVEDNAPPVCEIDGKSITLNNDTGEVKVKAEVFDDGSYDDCSNKVKIFAKRDDDGTICPCAPEDALDRYSDFIYLGRLDGHDYYMSEDTVIGPKAFNIALAMGGHVVIYEKTSERRWLSEQVEEYRINANPEIDVIEYTVTGPDGAGQSTQGWDSTSSNGFFMESTDRPRNLPYDGLSERKQFVVEVEDLCGYSEVIRFCCSDANIQPSVTFRTMDKWGNFNECDLVVDIADKVGPLIQCPPADTILCTDYSASIDLDQFGGPTLIDVCPANFEELDAVFDIDPCLTGTIMRSFKIEGDTTNTLVCAQTIVVEAVAPEDFEDPIDPKDIYLPDDAAMLGIAEGDLMCFEDVSLLDPADFPDMFIPQFVDNRVCSDLWIGYEDDIFEVPDAGASTCFKIVRHWTILDDCDMDNPIVLYEYDQSIIITNNDPADINFVNASTEICNEFGPNAECDGAVTFNINILDECTESADLNYTVLLDLDCDGNFETLPITSITDRVLANGRLRVVVVLDDLPIGDHKIIVEAVDACNNVSAAVHEFSIINCVPPIAACIELTMPLHCFPDPPSSPTINGNTVSATPEDCNGDGTIDADEQELYVYMCAQAEWFAPIKGESYHPCDIPVVYSFSPDTTDVERCFTCEDLKCPQNVTIYITDEFGNADTCISTMTLTDPKGLCPEIMSCFVPPNITEITLDTICIAGALPEDLSAFGITNPTIDATCCDDPDNDISFEDVELAVDADGCRRVQRTWTLFTDCGCPETETYEQTITIRNNDAPDLQCPARVDTIVVVDATGVRDCGTFINLPAATADNCQTSDLVITNDYRPANGADIVRTFFPIGTTLVNYTATNVCGLTSTCRTRIVITDETAPDCDITANVGPITVGLDGISFTDEEVLQQIFALAGNTVSDNCDSLRFVATPANLACTDLGANGMGTFDVMLTVTDEANNSTDCTATITLEEAGDPAIVCPMDRPDLVLNANCERVVPNYRPLVEIMNTCTSNIALANIVQSPAPGAVINGVSTQTIMMTATASNGQTYTCSFDIDFIDTTPPMVDCPDQAAIAELDAQCRARVPELRFASDNCLDSLPQTLVNGPGPRVYQQPRVGTIWDMSSEILVIAVDASGNRDTCEVNLTPVDNTDPVCNTPNPVGPIPIGLDGIMFTDQQVLDQIFAVNGNNVSDNCMDISFTSVPTSFGCADLDANGEGVTMVTFTVTDGNNNSTTCTATINLVEAGQPSISCPMDRPDLFLNANCERVVPNYRPLVDILNTCTSNITLASIVQFPAPGTVITGVSTQIITMTATASNGQSFSCSFDIDFLDNIPPNAECGDGQEFAALDELCRPRIPAVNFASDNCLDSLPRLAVNGPGPRVYQVPRAGRIWDMSSDVLVIAVDASGNRDTCSVALSASCPGTGNEPDFGQNFPDISVDSGDDCQVTINIPFTIDYCLPNNLVFSVTAQGPNEDDVDLTINSTGLSGVMPVDSHLITITATDPVCRLSTSVSFTYIVVGTGGIPPTFECKKIVKSIMDRGPNLDPGVTFDANEIVCVDDGLACDGSNPTVFGSFSDDPLDQTRTYLCTDLGDIQVTMFIYDVIPDGNGGLDTVFREPCFVIETVVDPGGICQFFTSTESNVTGRIQTEDGTGIENTSVALVGVDGSDEFMTEEHGLYAFPSMPMGGQYTITPIKEDNYTNGVSTLDIILMQKHILGLAPFDSPYKIIASDVNGSGTISATDLVEMRKVILSIKEGFDNSPSWKMVDASYQFFDIENPLVESYPNSYDISSLDRHMAIDFIGIKVGDVNLSADPSNMVRAETRTSGNTLDLNINPMVNGNQVKFDFSSDNFVDIEGFQFTFDFDPRELSFEQVEGSILDIDLDNLGLTKTDEGYITISYDKIGGVSTSSEELLFSLVFTHNGELKHDIATNSEVLAAQAYSTTDVFDLTSEVSYGNADIKLYQNAPNPWQETTEISFMLPVDMNYEMKFFTVGGELIHSIKAPGVGGLNTIEMQRDQLSTKGLIYYELITAHEKTTKRMILIR